MELKLDKTIKKKKKRISNQSLKTLKHDESLHFFVLVYGN